MKISRNDEANLPDFSSHDEARKYFKNQYGDRFVMMSSEMIDEQKVYFYSLLLDPETFHEGQKKLSQGETVNGLALLNSYQSVEIFEDGQIHIIH
ncbi:hypothetical protein [Sporosarcina sp. NPDC096371]|uniref:hypothetical protein n=1 Tax=Sporosarcina sp. NPDC096371 TaxID=3364530 RepID=UPI003818CBD1